MNELSGTSPLHHKVRSQEDRMAERGNRKPLPRAEKLPTRYNLTLDTDGDITDIANVTNIILDSGFLGYDDHYGARHLVNAFGISEIVYTEITE